MKDFPCFATDDGVASLILKEIPYRQEAVFYGDFWSSSGEQLGARLVNKEIPMPQAIVCANDAMALGAIRDLDELREVVRNSFEVRAFQPEKDADWDAAYAKFLRVTGLED